MIELTSKIKKDIIRLKYEKKATTGDIIRAYPGLNKKQVQSVVREYLDSESANIGGPE